MTLPVVNISAEEYYKIWERLPPASENKHGEIHFNTVILRVEPEILKREETFREIQWLGGFLSPETIQRIGQAQRAQQLIAYDDLMKVMPPIPYPKPESLCQYPHEFPMHIWDDRTEGTVCRCGVAVYHVPVCGEVVGDHVWKMDVESCVCGYHKSNDYSKPVLSCEDIDHDDTP